LYPWNGSCGQGGIGEALVTKYREEGLHPIATILPSESSDHLLQVGITYFLLDVTSDESIIELKKQIDQLTGGFLDILVNNA
jgi:1-acylglycerone phosphate reductase